MAMQHDSENIADFSWNLLANFLSADALTKTLVIIQPFGTAFVRLLQMIVVPLMFSSLIVGAASISPAQLGKVATPILLIYIFSSCIAVGIGLAYGHLFKPMVDVSAMTDYATRAAHAVRPISQILLDIIPTNIVAALAAPNVLAIIFFSCFFGICLSIVKNSNDERFKSVGQTTFDFFDGMAEVMIKVTKGIMQYAPVGVFALLCFIFARHGAAVAGPLVMVIITAYIGYLTHGLFYCAFIKFVGGVSVIKAWAYMKDPFITGFVTRSSLATLPVTMEAGKKMGIPKEVYSFAIPMGATINMDGTAVYLGVASTFIAYSVWGRGFEGGEWVIVMLTATLATIGTAGVPGAGVLMLMMVLTAVGLDPSALPMAAAAYAMILGVDAFLDMGRTAFNVVGDLVYCTGVCRRMKILDLTAWEAPKA